MSNPDITVAIAVIGLVVTLFGALGTMVFTIFKVGRFSGQMETTIASFATQVARVEKSAEALDRIPILETRLTQIAEVQSEQGRRFTSIVPPLVARVDVLASQVGSIRELRRTWGNGNRGSGGDVGE